MNKKKNPLVFLDMSIDGDPAERIFIEVMHFLNLLYWKETEVWFFSINIKIKPVSFEWTAFRRCCPQDCREFSGTLYRYFESLSRILTIPLSVCTRRLLTLRKAVEGTGTMNYCL